MPPEDDRPETVEQRRVSFGAVAESYDRVRPGYPEPLFDDLLRYAGPLPLRALDVGAGTGRATEPLLARGVQVHAIEPDPAMAAVLRRRAPAAQLSVAGFETTPAVGRYDLIVSAQAWHWVDPSVKWRRAAALLRTGGTLALFRNDDRPQETAVAQALQAAHDRWVPGVSLVPTRPVDDWPGRLRDRLADFTDFATRSYTWQRALTGDEYVELLSTMSVYAVRDADARAALFGEVRSIVGERIVLCMDTVLDLARRR